MLEKTQNPDNSAYRFVSLQGCNLIGQGKHSLIYLLNDKEIVKLYHDGTPLEQIELERRNGRAAFAQGISSCNTFETVETDQGYGIIFELVNGETLAEYMREHPDELESCAVRYADLLASFHAVKDTAGELPSTKDFFIESYENTPAAYYSRHDIDTLVRIINAIPDEDTYNHNDLHTQNVMINDRKELVMIDMAEITRGHPIFDLGSIYMVMVFSPKLSSRLGREVMGLGRKDARRVWHIMVRRYLGTNDPKTIAEFERLCRYMRNMRLATLISRTSVFSKLAYRVCALWTKLFVIARAETYIKAFSSMKLRYGR